MSLIKRSRSFKTKYRECDGIWADTYAQFWVGPTHHTQTHPCTKILCSKPIHFIQFSLSNPSTGFSYWPIGEGLRNPVGGHLRILMGERPFSWRFYRKFKCFAAFFAKNWAQYIVLKYFCLTYKLILFLVKGHCLFLSLKGEATPRPPYWRTLTHAPKIHAQNTSKYRNFTFLGKNHPPMCVHFRFKPMWLPPGMKHNKIN